MSLFKKDISKKELEKAFNEIQMNLENNYKDLAIKAYKDADLMLNNFRPALPESWAAKNQRLMRKHIPNSKQDLIFLPREWKVTVIVLMLSIRSRLK